MSSRFASEQPASVRRDATISRNSGGQADHALALLAVGDVNCGESIDGEAADHRLDAAVSRGSGPAHSRKWPRA